MDERAAKTTSEAQKAYDALSALPKVSELAKLAAGSLCDPTRAPFADADAIEVARVDLGLSREDGETPFGNAITVLERGPEDAAEKALVEALAAHAIAESPPRGEESESTHARDLLRLGARFGIDAFPLVDRALGDGALELWEAVGEAVRRADALKSGSGRAEAIVGAAALASATSDAARVIRKKLSSQVRDPLLVRIVGDGDAGAGSSEGERRLEGELTEGVRSPLRTTLLAVSGLLFAISVLRILGALALVYRRPAEVLVTKSGVRVRAKTMLLGRMLRETDTHIATPALVRASREVRYPRMGLYAGLFALAIGSYVGLSTFVDGVRAASPSMLLAGLVIVALGIALDFALGAVRSGAKGKCLVLFEPEKGQRVCVAGVDPKSADLALGLLRGR